MLAREVLAALTPVTPSPFQNCDQNVWQLAGQFHVPPCESVQAMSEMSPRHAVAVALHVILLANRAWVQS